MFPTFSVSTSVNGDVIHVKGECQPEMKTKKKNNLKVNINFTRGGRKLVIIVHTKKIMSIRPLLHRVVGIQSKIW